MHIESLFCPITPRINPHYAEACDQSVQWIGQYGLLPSAKALEAFNAVKVPEFIARAYPDADREDLGIMMDWTVWGFLADDEHDDCAHTPMRLRLRFLEYVDILRTGMTAGKSGARGALLDLRQRILTRSGTACLSRFVTHTAEWFDSMYWEAKNRSNAVRPKITDYLRAREVTVGMYTEYALFDVSHQTATSDDFWTAPDLCQLMRQAANIIGWSNDLFSYTKEREIGDPHNLVLLLGLERAMDDEVACEEVVAMHNEEMAQFLELEVWARTRGGAQHHAFIDMLRDWIRGNLDWAFSSGRYGLTMPADETPTMDDREVAEVSLPAIAA